MVKIDYAAGSDPSRTEIFPVKDNMQLKSRNVSLQSRAVGLAQQIQTVVYKNHSSVTIHLVHPSW